MPKYVVLGKRPGVPAKDCPIVFVTAPTQAEAALMSGFKYPVTAKVMNYGQAKDFTVRDTQEFAADDGTTVVRKTREEVEALRAADPGV